MPMDWEEWQKKDRGGAPDFEKLAKDFNAFRKKLPSAYILILIVVLLWVAVGGLYRVEADEVGVVKRWGRFIKETGPGLNYHLPVPIETVVTPKVTQVKRFEIGFRTINPGPPPRYQSVPAEALMLTGDENIVDVQFIVQYQIKHATNFLFKIADSQKTIKDAAEAAMREVIGTGKIDDVLTAEKFRIQQETARALQIILDDYESGLKVVAVQLQAVQPPEQVIAAFKDVASAREDQNRFINEAQGYSNDILPKAKGLAAKTIRVAEAYKEAKIKGAQGDTARFLSLLKEYNKAKDVTRKRLYLETMEQINQKAKKYILSGGTGNVLQLLPLEKLSGQTESDK